jgi:hypothetical protein
MSSHHAPRAWAWALNVPIKPGTLHRKSHLPLPLEPTLRELLIDSIGRFDPASLAILQRLDTLEGLLRAKGPTGNDSGEETTGGPSPLPISEELGSPALERSPESVPCYINIEAVLAWPVFENQGLDQPLDLKSLLQADNNEQRDPPVMSLGEDFESAVADRLLQQFLDNVHIFNPVLEGMKVREYMRSARFNGLGWDAPSCLLVSKFLLYHPATAPIFPAFDLCPWLYRDPI